MTLQNYPNKIAETIDAETIDAETKSLEKNITDNKLSFKIERSEWFKTKLGIETRAQFTERDSLQFININCIGLQCNNVNGIDGDMVPQLIDELNNIVKQLQEWHELSNDKNLA